MRDGFIFYRSFYEAIKELDFDEQLTLYEAIFEYQFNEYEPHLDGIKKSIWLLIKPQLDANNERYENGSKGGRPRREREKTPIEKTTGSKTKKPLVIENENHRFLNSKTNGYEIQKPKEKEKEKENVKEKEKEAEAEKEKEFGSASATNKTIKFYLDNINPMPTPREVEILESYENDTPEELIQYAMEKAVENKARSLGYIKAILNSWRAKGITTLAEAKEESKEKDEKQGRNSIHAGRVGTI